MAQTLPDLDYDNRSDADLGDAVEALLYAVKGYDGWGTQIQLTDHFDSGAYTQIVRNQGSGGLALNVLSSAGANRLRVKDDGTWVDGGATVAGGIGVTGGAIIVGGATVDSLSTSGALSGGSLVIGGVTVVTAARAISGASLNVGSGGVTGGAFTGSSLSVTGTVSCGTGVVVNGSTAISGTRAFTGASLNVGAGAVIGGAFTATSVSTGGGTISGGTFTIGGALDHNGSTVGFYGVTPAGRTTGFTLTYTGDSRDLPNLHVPSGNISLGVTNGSPYGYSTSDIAEQIIQDINSLRADMTAIYKFAHALAAAVRSTGLIG